MNANILKIGVVILALLLVKSCFFPAGTTRALKLTAEIDTPSGLRTGSSVIEFVSTPVPKWLPGSSGSSLQVKGESPVVDLGDGKRLYVLLHDEHFAHDVMALLDERRRGADNAIGSEDYPVLVTFADPTSAASVSKVAPGALAATFGDGFSLRRILAEPVDQSATFGTLAAIPLFRDHILGLTLEQSIAPVVRGGPVPASDPRRLTRSAFQLSAPR